MKLNRCEVCGAAAIPNRRKCYKCKQRQYAERHPRRVLYWSLNSSARNRGIEFDLTFEEFSLFCDATEYDRFVGCNGDSLTVDRIDPTRGYFLDNIRAIPHAQNSRENNHQKRLQTLRQFGQHLGA